MSRHLVYMVMTTSLYRPPMPVCYLQKILREPSEFYSGYPHGMRTAYADLINQNSSSSLKINRVNKSQRDLRAADR
jgi:hypothetical protein